MLPNRTTARVAATQSATLVRSTGCYAFRVTGRDLAERLVVRVLA
jgi:hypothetical protein